MKILQLTSARYMGGGERHIADLSRGLEAQGHDIFTAIAPGAAIRDHLSFLPNGRIAEFPFRGPLDFPTVSAIARLASKEKIDVIHAHVARDYTVAAAASILSTVPFVLTRHVLFRMSGLHRHLLRQTRFVIAPSDAVERSLRSQGIFPEGKIVTVRHGLSERPREVRPDNGGDRFIVGSVGNLDRVKGFDVLIRAAAVVTRSAPDVRFEIFGEDRESDRRNERELRELISTLDLAEHVSLNGWSPDIHETITEFDLFVSASRSESFGYALADAMLAGVPAIATETEGAKEVVADERQLVPIDSVEALAARISELIQDPAARQALAEKGRKHIQQNFSMQRMIEETEALYRRVLAVA